MSKRVLLVEWIDATNIEVRFAVRGDDSTKALLVYVTVDLGNGQIGVPTIWRCASQVGADRCRILGGESTHTEVTADLMQGAMTAFGQPPEGVDPQESLMEYLEGAL